MPCYEYVCESCHEQVELIQPISQCIEVGQVLGTPCACGKKSLRRIASICRSRGDTDFVANHGMLDKQKDERWLKQAAKAYKAQTGRKMPENAIYNPMLARFPLDPEAFVPHDNAIGYQRRLLEKRNWACEGDEINTTRDQEKAMASKPIQPKVRLAEDIIQANVDEIAKEDPGYVKANLDQVRQEVIETHGAPADRLTHDSPTSEL